MEIQIVVTVRIQRGGRTISDAQDHQRLRTDAHTDHTQPNRSAGGTAPDSQGCHSWSLLGRRYSIQNKTPAHGSSPNTNPSAHASPECLLIRTIATDDTLIGHSLYPHGQECVTASDGAEHHPVSAHIHPATSLRAVPARGRDCRRYLVPGYPGAVGAYVGVVVALDPPHRGRERSASRVIRANRPIDIGPSWRRCISNRSASSVVDRDTRRQQASPRPTRSFSQSRQTANELAGRTRTCARPGSRRRSATDTSGREVTLRGLLRRLVLVRSGSLIRGLWRSRRE